MQGIRLSRCVQYSDASGGPRLNPEHLLLLGPVEWNALAQNLLQGQMRGKGAVAFGDLDFGGEEGQFAALADQGPAAVCLVCNILDLQAAFQRSRPLVGSAERVQQGGVRC